MQITLRTLQITDMPAVMAIQAACYTDITPESENSMKAKLLASPATCFVAIHENALAGYLISLPWIFARPPALNTQHCILPDTPDCLYLHDLAIAPHARGGGCAAALVNTFLAQMPGLGLSCASLIAIQNSATYWQRYGFEKVAGNEELQHKIASYGDNVFYMAKYV